MGLIKFNQDIQSWYMSGYSIMKDVKTLNNIDYEWEFSLKSKP